LEHKKTVPAPLSTQGRFFYTSVFDAECLSQPGRIACLAPARKPASINTGQTCVDAWFLRLPCRRPASPFIAQYLFSSHPNRFSWQTPARSFTLETQSAPGFARAARRYRGTGETMRENTRTNFGPAAKPGFAAAAPKLADAADLRVLPASPGEPPWQEK